MREAKQTKDKDNNRGRDGDEEGKTAGVFWSEQVQQTNDENGGSGEFFRMRHTEILKGGERADCRGNEIVRNEQKRAYDRDNFGTMPDAGIDSATVRIEPANDYVINPDERGQNAHCGYKPERSITADGKGEADDIRFARAPIAVENRGR